MTTQFQAGPGIGIVGNDSMALLEPINTELAEVLWRLIESGAGVDELLEELSSRGLRSLGSFAMAQYEAGAVRIVVRGACSARIIASGSARDIGSNGVRTWVEEVVDQPESVSLLLRPELEPSAAFRTTEGLVPAALLRRGDGEATELRAVDWDRVADDIDHLLPPLPDASAAPAPVLPAVVVDSAAPVQPTQLDDPGRTISAAEFFAHTNDIAPGEAAQPEPAAAVAEPEPNEFDDIYGRTIARSVQSAAVHSIESDHEHAEQSTPTPAPPTVVPESATFSDQSTSAGVPSLIQEIPGVASPDLGDHDGRTMTKAQLAAMRAARGGADAPLPPTVAVTGPSVQALVCPSGHPNPPQLTACRKCFAPLSGVPTLVPRPVLAVLRFQDGSAVSLDRPTLIGRNPKVEGAIPNEMPALHRLDVGQGLSRTHASIRLEGWQVLLDDLNSANGTIVTLPGREPRRLHPGEPVLLETGALIDFGGEVLCTVEAG